MHRWLVGCAKVVLAWKSSSDTEVACQMVLVEVVNPACQQAQMEQQGIGRVGRQGNFLYHDDALLGRADAERAFAATEHHHVFLQYQRIQSGLFFEVELAEICIQKKCPGIRSRLVHERKDDILNRDPTAVDDALGGGVSSQSAQPLDELFELGKHGVLACGMTKPILRRVPQ